MFGNLHPGLILIFGGILAGFLPTRLRQAVMVGVPALAVFSMFNLQLETIWSVDFINNMQLILLKVDKLSWVFGLIFSIMALLGNIYSLHNKNSWEATAGLLYAGSSLGVVFAGDWMTLIFFWELMAASSVFLIWYRGNAQARGAGFRYILVHAFGGNLFLAGIFLKMMAGQPDVMLLTGTNDTAFWLILLGVAINAAIPPLHAWLTDAYPEGTITGSVFLSSFTTKVAVYTLIRLFAGTELLIWAGVIMALYGVVYAVLENDIRRLLAYHIISQVGYMVAAVGMGTDLALNGATAHAFSHILYKSLLFMGAGAVIYATGRRKLTELGGFFREMPVAVILYMIGAFSISGVPLWNGFISKSMIISAASYNHMPAVELLLYLASIGTWLHTGLKLPYFMFFGPDRGIKLERKLPLNMYVAMGGGAFLCTLYGVAPFLLYQYLPFAAEYHPYSWDHVVSTVQLLVAALAAFWIYIPKLGGEPTISVDTDWFYRKPVKALMIGIVNFVCTTRDFLGAQGMAALKSVLPFFANPVKWAPQTKEGPALAEYDENRYRFPIGVTVLMSLIVFLITVSYIWIA
ncbi:MAG: multicomponent Na+:H+ antiporter subunit [Clostridia bacterium]|jgi:multicomponent Na+:H+ antiporter subunit D|nr:multicomponent Na+:H+ antiporter subunit [Clostridia bacterium]MDN5323803.1 multicomponent Na+:H+ antiporter subunit [Clostridia bacterium]